MNKIIHVPAFFEPLGKNKKIKVPTGERKKGLFGAEKDVMRDEIIWVKTGDSDSKIDSKRLADDLEGIVNSLNNEGYEVVSVTPITSGSYDYEWKTELTGSGGYGYGYGYSYTNSLIVVARKNDR